MLVALELATAEPEAIIQVGVMANYEIEIALHERFGKDYKAQASTT
jgi:hypothetical protein